MDQDRLKNDVEKVTDSQHKPKERSIVTQASRYYSDPVYRGMYACSSCKHIIHLGIGGEQPNTCPNCNKILDWGNTPLINIKNKNVPDGRDVRLENFDNIKKVLDETTEGPQKQHVPGIIQLEQLGFKIIKRTSDLLRFEKKTEETYRRYGWVIDIQIKSMCFAGFYFNDDLFNSKYSNTPMSFDINTTRILLQILEEL